MNRSFWSYRLSDQAGAEPRHQETGRRGGGHRRNPFTPAQPEAEDWSAAPDLSPLQNPTPPQTEDAG
jgi:hypothetical protein